MILSGIGRSRQKQAVVVVLFLLFACPAYAQNQEVMRTLKGLKYDTLRYIDGLDMYEAISNNEAVYLSKDKRYLFIGRVVDLQTKRDITLDRINSLRRFDFVSLNLANAIKMGSGKTSIAVFSDLGCGYCKMLHAEMEKLSKDITAYIFLYPLAVSNPNAKNLAASILCAKDRLSALNSVWSAKKQTALPGKPTPACQAAIEENIRYGRDRGGVTLTPTIILEDGRVFMGYKNAAELAAIIKEGK